jgi:hypothetical protein
MAKLLVSVLKSGSDCTAGGISSKHEHLFLCTTKEEAAELHAGGEPALYLEVKEYSFGTSLAALPPYDKDAGSVGWMMGGNYVGSSHSDFERLFGTSQPIKVHDRQESQAYYDSTWY